MRRVSLARVVLAVFTIVVSVAAYADDQFPGTEPPQVRIGPPIGAASNDEPPTVFELFLIWLQVRIGPPIG